MEMPGSTVGESDEWMDAHRQLDQASPAHILQWALRRFGDEVIASSSFQTQSMPLLHMISLWAPRLPVIFLDTGYHFPETLAFRDKIVSLWKLNLRIARTASGDHPAGQPQGNLYQRDPDLCCHLHKVVPMQEALRGYRAWISGIIPDQTAERAHLQVLEPGASVLRIHPLAFWSRRDVFNYIAEHRLPEHPLTSQGYLSIGCEPCTRPVQIGEMARAGRWAQSAKTECGLHTQLRPSAMDKTP